MITNLDRKKGFGNQLLTLLYTIVYAKIHNLDFYYSPITTLEHISNQEEIEELQKMLEKSLIFPYPISNNKILDNYKNVMKYVMNNISNEKIINEFKNLAMLFNDNKTNNYKTIAIHIRRNDDFDESLSKNSLGVKMYLKRVNAYSDKFYNKLIEKLLLEYPEHEIHIYSTNLNIKNYENSKKIIFHLNESLVDTFISLTSADILVTGASSLSYCAGLLQLNKVIYVPYNYIPLKHWIIYK